MASQLYWEVFARSSRTVLYVRMWVAQVCGPGRLLGTTVDTTGPSRFQVLVCGPDNESVALLHIKRSPSRCFGLGLRLAGLDRLSC